MRRHSALVLAILCSAFVGTAHGQPVYLMQPSTAGCTGVCPGRLLTVALDTPAILDSRPIPAADNLGSQIAGSGGTYATPDGALLLWLEPSRAAGLPPLLGIHALATRTSTTLTLPLQAQGFVGHPRRSEIFLTDAVGPIAMSLAGVRRLSAPSCAGPSSLPLQISGDGSRVLYSCAAFGEAAFILDADSGSTVAMVNGTFATALSGDGHELFRLEVAPASTPPAFVLRRYATADGSLLMERNMGALQTPYTVRVDPRTRRVFVIGGTAVSALDPVTLEPVAAGVVPHVAQAGGVETLTFDPNQPMMYVSTIGIVEPSDRTVGYHALRTDDLTTAFTLVAGGQRAATFMAPPRPAAPVSLVSTVQGTTVHFSWTAGVSNATTLGYVLEAGTAPGAANLVTFDVGLPTTFAVSGVPPGTYYVRVRAANVSGSGPASNEVVVTVS